MPERLTLSFTDEDRRKLEALQKLLQALHGYAPRNLTDTIRAAIDFMLTAKEQERDKKRDFGPKR